MGGKRQHSTKPSPVVLRGQSLWWGVTGKCLRKLLVQHTSRLSRFVCCVYHNSRLGQLAGVRTIRTRAQWEPGIPDGWKMLARPLSSRDSATLQAWAPGPSEPAQPAACSGVGPSVESSGDVAGALWHASNWAVWRTRHVRPSQESAVGTLFRASARWAPRHQHQACTELAREPACFSFLVKPS